MEEIKKYNIDTSCYVAIGDSITAGYTDGALCYYGQQSVYVNLIAHQFKFINGGDFKQPLISSESVGIGAAGNSCLVLNSMSNHIEPTSFKVEFLSDKGDLSIFSENIYSTHGPFHNMGIPGAKAISIVQSKYGNPDNGAGNFNPFYTRIASNPYNSSILNDVLKISPTFFTLFIGNNDVLAYALSGATTNDIITPLEGPSGIGFKASVYEIIETLTSNGAFGAIANLADLDVAPYFNAIPYNGLILNQDEALLLNDKYKFFGINFIEGKNSFLINDSVENSDQFRQIKKGEFILLDLIFDVHKDDYLRGIIPIPKKYVLTISEKLKSENAIILYNECIKTIAKEKKIAHVDVNSLLKKIRLDRIYDGILRDFKYKNGGVFSLDGLHPNAYGQALLANEFINAINITYQTNVPLLDCNEFKNIIFP